jgi:hypothetical protein
MSTHINGVRDLDGQFAAMMAVKLACEAAGIGFPDEVKDYFGAEVEESEEYLRREMEAVDIEDAVREYSRVGTNGWKIDLAKLPEGVKAIRFENSY